MSASVTVIVRFVSIMQHYSNHRREVRRTVPPEADRAVFAIMDQFNIPWTGNLEKSTRIFINQKVYDPLKNEPLRLNDNDTIAIIPISGGG